MALTTKSGALWQMSRAEKEEGWTDEGHAFVGREVVRSTSATAQSVGTIYCWLPPTVEDCYADEDGKPAPLFKVRFLVGELDGDVEDGVELKFRGASRVRLNHDLHAIDATPARWRGAII